MQVAAELAGSVRFDAAQVDVHKHTITSDSTMSVHVFHRKRARLQLSEPLEAQTKAVCSALRVANQTSWTKQPKALIGKHALHD